MEIEKLAVVVRPRTPWEAVDLGFRLGRAWWKPLLGAWLAVSLPVFLILHGLLIQQLWLAPILLWWLKPLFERPLLLIVSRGFFGEVPTVGEAIRALPSQLRGLGLGLSLGRFSQARSYLAPVSQLEGLSGRRRFQRVRVLAKEQYGTAVMLTLACVHIESLPFYFGVIAGIWMFTPGLGFIDVWNAFVLGEGVGTQFTLVSNAVAYLAMSIVAPFYVAGGFALYIQRRVALEGWDLELTFRRLSARVSATKPKTGSPAKVAAALALCWMLVPSFGEAGELLRSGDSPRVIESVMDDPALGIGSDKKTVWVPKLGELDLDNDGFAGAESAAEFLRIGLVGTGVLLLFLMLRALFFSGWGLPRRAGRKKKRKTKADVPEFVAGLDLRPESLPSDIPAAARSHWDAGESRAAMSLLYRGALAFFFTGYALRLPPSATEEQCLARVGEVATTGLFQDFGELTRSWQLVAYARSSPSNDVFSSLCRTWSSHLGTRS